MSGDKQIVTFDVKDVPELLGQLVGACSSTRFWDLMKSNYPFGEGVFREDIATDLVEAAMVAYLKIVSDTGSKT